MKLLLAGFDYANSSSLAAGMSDFIEDRSLIWAIWDWVREHGQDLVEWLRGYGQVLVEWLREHGQALVEWLVQPHVLAPIVAWCITFTVVYSLFAIGFNKMGIGAGTLAAAFQSWAYGGFTPAGSIFATLTSLGMLGYLNPPGAGCASVAATAVSLTVWACGVGR